MDTHLEAKLIECLDALAQGESIERILARYPQEAAQLRPLLETAAGLPALRLEPSEAARMQSRQKFMAQADLLRGTKQRRPLGFLPRLATGFIAAALVAGVLGTGAVAAAGSALPGDPLYGLKRTVEEVQLNTASSPAQRQELQREFEQRRRNETNELLDARRASEVEFTGTIEEIQPSAWIVSSLVVQLDANTQIVGTPQIDRLAEVRGATGPQGLRASFISIESAGEPEITPTPEATETPQATETPEPSEPAAPLATVTPRPAATLPPAATPQPTEAAPQPAEVEFTGSVNSMGEETWNIDGAIVGVNNDTEIQGAINTGQRVKVKALRFADGSLVAVRIELSEGGGSGSDSNGNDSQNSNENHNSDDGNSNDGGNTNDNSSSDNTENGGSTSNDDGNNANSNDNSGSRNGNDDRSGNGNGNGD